MLRSTVIMLTLAACARDPLEVDCPAAGVGGLVLSEVRGPQATGDDADGQWIEIYNPGGTEVALGGLVVRVRKLDGSSEVRLTVRDASVGVPAGGYAVLGRFKRGDEPAHVDYGYAGDFEGDLYGDGVVDLIACGEVVDTAAYGTLPGAGTRSLPGTAPPAASANDSAAAWCNDATIAGTPGQDNASCM